MKFWRWLIWFSLGGGISSLFWLVQGLLCFILVFCWRRGVACFRIARYALDPFTHSLVLIPADESKYSTFRFLVYLTFGAIPFACHSLTGLCWMLTMIGLPIADRFFEIASVCLNPCRVKSVRSNDYADEKESEELADAYAEWSRNFNGRIFALPYMSCRGRSFKHCWHTLGNFVPMDYCEMMFTHSYYETAKVLVDKYNIKDGDIVIGTCLGAMVAQEMVRLRKLKALILVAAPLSKNDYYQIYNILAPMVIKMSSSVLRFLFNAVPMIPPRIANILKDEAGVENIRKFAVQAVSWRGVKLDLPVCRIHGDADFLFPIPSKCDYLMHGGHFIGILNSDACVVSVKRFIVKSFAENMSIDQIG